MFSLESMHQISCHQSRNPERNITAHHALNSSKKGNTFWNHCHLRRFNRHTQGNMEEGDEGGHLTFMARNWQGKYKMQELSVAEELVKEGTVTKARHFFVSFWLVSLKTKDSRIHRCLQESNSSFHKNRQGGACDEKTQESALRDSSERTVSSPTLPQISLVISPDSCFHLSSMPLSFLFLLSRFSFNLLRTPKHSQQWDNKHPRNECPQVQALTRLSIPPQTTLDIHLTTHTSQPWALLSSPPPSPPV